ncbi:MAG: Abi family protein [Cetobacterium sp.]
MKYTKKYLTYEEQIENIKMEKFLVSDEDKLRKFLENVNYFKLREYFKKFEVTEKNHGNISIEKVMNHYYFNRELRSILFKMSEKIEISIKNKIAYTIGKNYGAFGHTDPKTFHETFNHEEFLRRLIAEESRGTEDFVIEFKNKYDEEKFIPVWIAVEILTFGTISKMFDFMHNKDKKEIARSYGINAPILSSWLANLTLMRNFCAHNSQIWNKNFKPIAQKPTWNMKDYNPRRVAGMVYMMCYMINQINDSYDYSDLKKLIINHAESSPEILKELGFLNIESLETL